MSKVPLTRTALHMLLLEDSERGREAVGRALVALSDRQTKDEKRDQRSKYHNSVGFNSVDARIGVDNAKDFIRYGKLTERQLQYWRTPDRYGNVRICKYIDQLLLIARRKAGMEEAVQLNLPL